MIKKLKNYKIVIIFIFTFILFATVNKTFASQNNNANLKSLFVDREALDPEFSSDVTNYSLFVYGNVNNIKIDATPEDEKATVSVTGNNNLKLGDNIINIDVTSADKSEKKQYKIIVTKTNNFEKSNSYLLNLIVENATMSPNFKPQVFNYDLGYVANDVKSLRLFVFPQDENVPYTVIGNDELKEGDNEIIIKVTSPDKLTTKTYTLKVHRNSAQRDEEVGKKEPEIEYITTEKDSENDGILDFFYKNKIIFIVIIIILIAVIILINMSKKRKNKKII